MTPDESKKFLRITLEELIPIAESFSPECQELFQSIVAIYIRLAVEKEPKRPAGWDLSEKICDCGCKKRLEMNEFLRNPETETHQLHGRNLFHQLDRYRYCKFSVHSSPGTTTVIKTLKWWLEKHIKWEKQCSVALKVFQKLPQELPQDKLKQCLAHRYDELMDLRIVKVSYKFTHAEPSSEASGRFQITSLVPQKRPGNVLEGQSAA